MSDQRYYEIVAEELQRKFLRPGLWARSVAETGGEGDTARAHYIRLRVLELIETEQIEHSRMAEERKHRAAEEARVLNEQREAEARSRKEEERRRAQEEEEERLRIDTERAASPHFGLLLLGGVVALILLFILIHLWIHLFSR